MRKEKTMKRDPVVLGHNYVLSGSDIGKTRPNTNVLVVGSSGCGKSFSVVVPTIGRGEHSNPILSYAKEADAYAMARYLHSKGRTIRILNIAHPDKSNVSFDPLLSIESYEDIDCLSTAIVNSVLQRSADDYWQAKAKPLNASLITAALMNAKKNETPGMIDVLNLFDQLVPRENGYSVETPLDRMFSELEKAAPGCYAVREYRAWHSLPYRTASCVRDTLAAALSTVFPESIRNMMRKKPQFDVERFVKNKEALIVITDAIDPSQAYYANLFYRDTDLSGYRASAAALCGNLPER